MHSNLSQSFFHSPCPSKLFPASPSSTCSPSLPPYPHRPQPHFPASPSTFFSFCSPLPSPAPPRKPQHLLPSFHTYSFQCHQTDLTEINRLEQLFVHFNIVYTNVYWTCVCMCCIIVYCHLLLMQVLWCSMVAWGTLSSMLPPAYHIPTNYPKLAWKAFLYKG